MTKIPPFFEKKVKKKKEEEEEKIQVVVRIKRNLQKCIHLNLCNFFFFLNKGILKILTRIIRKS
jgi:hypothetical protein